MSFLKNLLSLLRKSPESQKKITEDDIRGDDTRMAVSARGEKLKDVDVQSDIFEGLKFSECIYHWMFSSV